MLLYLLEIVLFHMNLVKVKSRYTLIIFICRILNHNSIEIKKNISYIRVNIYKLNPIIFIFISNNNLVIFQYNMELYNYKYLYLYVVTKVEPK